MLCFCQSATIDKTLFYVVLTFSEQIGDTRYRHKKKTEPWWSLAVR